MDIIDWSCDTCHRKTDGAGAISIAYESIRTAQADRKSAADGRGVFTAATVADVLDLPSLGLWKVECDACAGECLFAYWIDLKRASTPSDLEWWTSHLSSKTWITATNWSALVASVGTTQPIRSLA